MDINFGRRKEGVGEEELKEKTLEALEGIEVRKELLKKKMMEGKGTVKVKDIGVSESRREFKGLKGSKGVVKNDRLEKLKYEFRKKVK